MSLYVRTYVFMYVRIYALYRLIRIYLTIRIFLRTLIVLDLPSSGDRWYIRRYEMFQYTYNASWTADPSSMNTGITLLNEIPAAKSKWQQVARATAIFPAGYALVPASFSHLPKTRTVLLPPYCRRMAASLFSSTTFSRCKR